MQSASQIVTTNTFNNQLLTGRMPFLSSNQQFRNQDKESMRTDHFGALAELVEYDQRAGGGVADGHGDLVEVDAERRQVGRDALGGSHAGEDLVDETDLGGVGRHEAADMSHEHDQSNLGTVHHAYCSLLLLLLKLHVYLQ